MNDTFCIVIDGGGTKTAVTIISDREKQYFNGYGGPANVFSLSKTTVLNSIITGVEDALQQRARFYSNGNDKVPLKPMDMNIRKLYVGLAGAFSVNRDKLAEMESLIRNMFLGVNSLKVSSDLFLLPLAIPPSRKTKYCIALIAGTGSSSFCFEYSREGDFDLVGRSGGWGPQLGDPGAGYSIGLNAIKSTLRAIDQYNVLKSLGEDATLKGIHGKIFSTVVKTDHDGKNTSDFFKTIDRLFNCTDMAGDDTRKQIASLTKVLFEALGSSDGSEAIAQDILERESQELVQVLMPFINVIDPSDTTLILSGSLFMLPTYYTLFSNLLAASKIEFNQIEIVAKPSVSVIQQLVRNQ